MSRENFFCPKHPGIELIKNLDPRQQERGDEIYPKCEYGEEVLEIKPAKETPIGQKRLVL